MLRAFIVGLTRHVQKQRQVWKSFKNMQKRYDLLFKRFNSWFITLLSCHFWQQSWVNYYNIKDSQVAKGNKKEQINWKAIIWLCVIGLVHMYIQQPLQSKPLTFLFSLLVLGWVDRLLSEKQTPFFFTILLN